MKLLGSKVSLIPGKSSVRFGIIIPDRYRVNSIARVTGVGPKVSKPIVEGAIVITPIQFTEKKHQIIDESTGEFVCEAKNIFAVVVKNNIYPLGNTILIERIVSERNEGGIIIPEAQRATDQSLEGVVARFGMGSEKKTIQGITIGDRVRLARWEAHMIECGWVGRFYVIVNEEDIIAAYK